MTLVVNMNVYSQVTTQPCGEIDAVQPFDRATLDALISLCPSEMGDGLLVQLLADFCRLEEGVRDSVTRKDITVLAARSHEIKGLAATLSAISLAKRADAVQGACDNSSGRSAPGDLAAPLLTELRTVITALQGMSIQTGAGQPVLKQCDIGQADAETASHS